MAQLIFHQLFEAESSTYTYLLADSETKEAILIDPVLETVDRDLKLLGELGLRLVYVLDTHVHADHVTGAGILRERTGAKTGVGVGGNVACADLALVDGQTLSFGRFSVRVLATPGHTDSCVSYVCEGRVFTGDALLIRGTGRTDFQQGSSERLYQSIKDKLFVLPPGTLVYPGHDYRGHTSSTIGAEMQHNPRVGGGRTLAEFAKIMAELKLANPKKIHEAVPANMACGKRKDACVLKSQVVDGLREVMPEEVARTLGQVQLIDVRRPDEFNGELAHIPGARLVTLGPELTAFLQAGDRSQEIAFVCRSGGRSGQATAESVAHGYKFTANMVGGMIRWNELRLATERSA